jgi:hypothetical protein
MMMLKHQFLKDMDVRNHLISPFRKSLSIRFSATETKFSSGFGISPVTTVAPGQRLAIVENTRIPEKQYGDSCRKGEYVEVRCEGKGEQENLHFTRCVDATL